MPTMKPPSCRKFVGCSPMNDIEQRRDKIQADIICDWIDKIVMSVTDIYYLSVRCRERFGNDIYVRHENTIVDRYNYHIDMLENNDLQRQWDNQEDEAGKENLEMPAL